jgi:hypothetical protein
MDASPEEWQEVLSMAIRFASDCATAYGLADDRTRTQFNAALFAQLLVRDGRGAEALSGAVRVPLRHAAVGIPMFGGPGSVQFKPR